MKLINFLIISVTLLLLTTRVESKKNTRFEISKLNKKEDLAGWFEVFFGDKTRSKMPCSCLRKKTDDDEMLQQETVIEEDGTTWAVPQSKTNYHQINKQGDERSAYFFDYIDPFMGKTIIEEFTKMFEELNNLQPLETFEDPYTLEKLAGKITKGTYPSETDLIQKIKSIKPNFNMEKWREYYPVPVIAAVIREWKWNADPSSTNPAKSLIDKYDFDGNGRLDKREFALAAIRNNKNIIETDQKCKYCFKEISRDMIDFLFAYVDCDDSSTATSEEIWAGFKNLQRGTNMYNIYDSMCKVNGQDYRTSAVNEFVLKAQRSLPGKLTKQEFRLGILTGFWYRQVDADKGILQGDEINGKSRRWSRNGRDRECSIIKNAANSRIPQ
jgi:hypothetical protein